MHVQSCPHCGWPTNMGLKVEDLDHVQIVNEQPQRAVVEIRMHKTGERRMAEASAFDFYPMEQA